MNKEFNEAVDKVVSLARENKIPLVMGFENDNDECVAIIEGNLSAALSMQVYLYITIEEDSGLPVDALIDLTKRHIKQYKEDNGYEIDRQDD